MFARDTKSDYAELNSNETIAVNSLRYCWWRWWRCKDFAGVGDTRARVDDIIDGGCGEDGGGDIHNDGEIAEECDDVGDNAIGDCDDDKKGGGGGATLQKSLLWDVSKLRLCTRNGTKTEIL
ncbi:Hypothetical predicted protein [Octopus vulgaris]|uniref:Uncharacterized protein n=1 Tax=Octopus vulgaris TaxID=6645 RepID=A0AA36BTW8_OCTVU|nr:Hypothetical predicted protein [Octopus vulgaris]